MCQANNRLTRNADSRVAQTDDTKQACREDNDKGKMFKKNKGYRVESSTQYPLHGENYKRCVLLIDKRSRAIAAIHQVV
jgi:hypothetical protein